MGLFSSIKNQLRSVIQWDNPQPDVLFHRWSDSGDEIKNASKLIVNPGQGCIFVYEGRVEAVWEQEGVFELRTANIPFWTTLTKFMQAFVSEHKVGLYFYRKTQILDQKWGTSSLVKYSDPVYKFPVALRARGNYSFQIADARSFFVNVIGAAPDYHLSDFRSMMSARIVEPLTDYFAESGFSYADIDRQRQELSAGCKGKLVAEFQTLGFSITDFRIEGTEFDEDTMRRINRIADLSAEAQAAQAAGVNFAQLQQLEALKAAAANPSGAAGAGVGVGAGIGLGQMMGAGMMAPQAVPAAPPPPPLQKTFHAVINNQQAGPFDAQTLAQYARQGALTSSTLVWSAGMPGWSAAGSVPELAGLFAQVPPPVPPPMPPPLG